MQATPATQGSSVVNTNQSATLLSTASVEPQPISLSPRLLDQLVSQVADEVTRRLSHLDGTSTTLISSTSGPSSLSEVSLVSTPPLPASGAPVPGT